MSNYKNKYLKYKSKYINLKNQIGGTINKISLKSLLETGYNPNTEAGDMGGTISLKALLETGYNPNTEAGDIDVTVNMSAEHFLDNNNLLINNSITFSPEEVNQKDKLVDLFKMLKLNSASYNFYVDPNTGKFNDRFFKLDSSSTKLKSYTYHNKIGRSNKNNFNIVKCANSFMNNTIDRLKISKVSDTVPLQYNLISINGSDVKLIVENNSLESILNKIKKEQIKSDRSCKSHNSEGASIRFSDRFKQYLASNPDDFICLPPDNNYIIKSKKLLITDSIVHTIESYSLDESNNINEIILKESLNNIHVNLQDEYEQAIKLLYAKLTNGINANLSNPANSDLPPQYKTVVNVPFGFFHIHITSVKDEPNKMVIIMHAGNENPSDDLMTRTYYFKKLDGTDIEVKQRRFETTDHQQKVQHNHIALIDISPNFNIKLYSFNYSKLQSALTAKPNLNIGFYQYYTDTDSMEDIYFTGIKYNLFGNHLGDINYHEDGIVTVSMRNQTDVDSENSFGAI